MIVRLYNLTGERVHEVWVLAADITCAWRTNLLEERTTELEISGSREVLLELTPHQIVTVEV